MFTEGQDPYPVILGPDPTLVETRLVNDNIDTYHFLVKNEYGWKSCGPNPNPVLSQGSHPDPIFTEGQDPDPVNLGLDPTLLENQACE